MLRTERRRPEDRFGEGGRSVGLERRDDEVHVRTIMRPTGVGHRRAVPRRLEDDQRERLRWLLDDPHSWVLRASWEHFLASGDEALVISTDRLTRDQRSAALAWLQQQRHALYHALEGGVRAPEGWLESLPMFRALTPDTRRQIDDRRLVPAQPGGPPVGG